MPAHRRNKKPKTSLKPLFLIFLLIAFIISGILLIKNRTWVGDAKLVLAINNSESIVIGVFDPRQDDINILDIPGKVEVDVARSLGKWKLESVWRLGENEGLEGRLLAETILKNFKVPVTAWAESYALAYLTNGNILKATLGRYRTNLTLADRLRLLIFSLQVKEFKKSSLNLATTSLLKGVRLKDGEMGYVVTDVMPQKLMLITADNLISESNLKVQLINATGGFNITKNVGGIVEALGTKVAVISNAKVEDCDCSVAAKERKVAQRFALILGCEIDKQNLTGNFDVEIKIGRKFESRF